MTPAPGSRKAREGEAFAALGCAKWVVLSRVRKNNCRENRLEFVHLSIFVLSLSFRIESTICCTDCFFISPPHFQQCGSVSYTHLTLPTNREV